MEDKYKIILPVIIIVAVFGLLLITFTSIYSNIKPTVIESYSVTNASAGDVYVAGARLKNNTLFEVRTTPENSFRCTRVNWGLTPGVNNGSNGIKQLTVANGPAEFSSGVTEALCTGNGTIRLFLAGNTSNGSLQGRGKHYNISFTGARWTAAWNVSQNQQNALYSAGQQSSTYWTLLVLTVVLSIALAYTGFRISSGGGGGGGEGRGFDLSNIFDKFER